MPLGRRNLTHEVAGPGYSRGCPAKLKAGTHYQSSWFHDDLYFFVWTMDGIRTLNAADPSLEGRNGSDVKDVVGRPYGRMLLEAASGSAGEGWVHDLYPEPGDIFPAWKSVFVKRVTFPSGKQHLVAAKLCNQRLSVGALGNVRTGLKRCISGSSCTNAG